ncbi:hypothetical protein GCM10025876_16290 [Demequina litorisediminis]|uniref:Secreted protein n=1 Tax=Demequina litorisediminis TaxID=1849022 RepID=A0ABQ6ICB9_9MICO|nr:hypothetical protein GCM10025876_16290 [Demequina litorisediminis]
MGKVVSRLEFGVLVALGEVALLRLPQAVSGGIVRLHLADSEGGRCRGRVLAGGRGRLRVGGDLVGGAHSPCPASHRRSVRPASMASRPVAWASVSAAT